MLYFDYPDHVLHQCVHGQDSQNITCFINTFIKHVFTVKFKDPFKQD
jgi:hypothetical protein